VPRYHVAQSDRIPARHDHRAFDGILQLAHVPRPVVREDPPPRGVVEIADLLAILFLESGEKLRRQQVNVLGSLA
jgi:hypothetical protein